jgi:hypothetical protein
MSSAKHQMKNGDELQEKKEFVAEQYSAFLSNVQAAIGFVLLFFISLCLIARSNQRSLNCTGDSKSCPDRFPTQSFLESQAVHTAVTIVAGLLQLTSMQRFRRLIPLHILRILTPVCLVITLVLNIGIFVYDCLFMFHASWQYYDNMYTKGAPYQLKTPTRWLIFISQCVLYSQLIGTTVYIMGWKRLGFHYLDQLNRKSESRQRESKRN